MEDRRLSGPGENPEAAWEARVKATANAFSYPPTPNIARDITRRLQADRRPHGQLLKLRWMVAISIFALVVTLMAVPAVRGAVMEVLRVGAVRIFRNVPAPTMVEPTSEPAATVVPISSVLNLPGETTLEDARSRVRFPLRLPQYPPRLGTPDAVFVQDMQGPVVIMVWRDASSPAQVALSLYQMSAGAYFAKIEPQVIQETDVNGQPAIWAEGPYALLGRNGNIELRRLVEGNALIWTEGPVTYRLETGSGLDEARRIAESLR